MIDEALLLFLKVLAFGSAIVLVGAFAMLAVILLGHLASSLERARAVKHLQSIDVDTIERATRLKNIALQADKFCEQQRKEKK